MEYGEPRLAGAVSILFAAPGAYNYKCDGGCGAARPCTVTVLPVQAGMDASGREAAAGAVLQTCEPSPLRPPTFQGPPPPRTAWYTGMRALRPSGQGAGLHRGRAPLPLPHR